MKTPSINCCLALLVGSLVLPCKNLFPQEVDYFADNGLDNPLSTLQHPCAESFNGRTYVAYQGPHEDPYVAVYDHAAQKWEGPVRAGISEMGKTPDPIERGIVDNHGRPALLVDGEGYIHIIFGGHGGSPNHGENTLGTPGKGRQTHMVSDRPEDIFSWTELDNISPFGTYSQFVKMEDGDIYLFYRHGSHRSDWVYQKSTDNCRTFEEPVSVLKHKVRPENPTLHDAWYAWFGRGTRDTIVVTYIYHRCSTAQHEKARFNAYFMKMNCTEESWQNAANEVLVMPVDKEQADKKTNVYDSGDNRCDRGSVTVDNKGNPHLHFRHASGHLFYTRWLGDSWQDPSRITDTLKHQDGDLQVDSPNLAKILIAGNQRNGGGKLSWWKTTDGGLTWEKEMVVVSSSRLTYVMSAFVHNASPDALVVINDRDPKLPHLYRRMYLWGRKGFLGTSF